MCSFGGAKLPHKFDAPIDTYETNISGTSILLESIKNNCKESIVHVCASSEVLIGAKR